MKRIICAVLAVLMLAGCAYAEETGLEMWQREGGWTTLAKALTGDGLKEAWEHGAEVFAQSLGMPSMNVETLQGMMLQGFNLESGIDGITVDGNRVTGSLEDGTEVFSHEYSLVETLQQADVPGGAAVYVFQAAEEAGEYNYIALTEPEEASFSGIEFMSFNMVHTATDYMKMFGGALIPCTMVATDTDAEALQAWIDRLFAEPIVIAQ